VKPVLVDTSVWRRYFAGAPAVKGLGDLSTSTGPSSVHPFVIGELVLGGLSAREEGLFARLPPAAVVPTRRSSPSSGDGGWHAAASAGSTPTSSPAPSPRAEHCGRWNGDLRAAAADLGAAYSPATGSESHPGKDRPQPLAARLARILDHPEPGPDGEDRLGPGRRLRYVKRTLTSLLTPGSSMVTP